MATYLDVASLVGIKISTSGSVSAGNSYTVPADSFAYAFFNYPTATTFNPIAVVPAGGVLAVSSGGQATLNAVNKGPTSGGSITYVVFTNNQ